VMAHHREARPHLSAAAGRSRGLRAVVSLFRHQCLASRGDVHVTCRFRARKGITASFRATFPSSKLAMWSRRDAALKAPYEPVCQLTFGQARITRRALLGTFRAARDHAPWRVRFDNFLATSRSPFFTSSALERSQRNTAILRPRCAGVLRPALCGVEVVGVRVWPDCPLVLVDPRWASHAVN
jgi:hypothetical protein